jgi:hypothetical protein
MDIRTISSRVLIAVITCFMISTVFNSCYYDSEEELYPGSLECDVTNVTYSGTVAPILQSRCNSCHNQSNASGGVVTDSYFYLIISVENGTFWGSINHDKGYTRMPKDDKKLSYCELTKIKAWIDGGAPNN